MKFLSTICFLIIVLISSFVNAQTPSTRIGVVVGDNLSTYSGISGAKFSNHFCLGLYSSFKIKEKLSIDPYLFLKFNGGASGLTLQAPAQFPTGSFDTTDVKRMTNYLSLMVSVNYKLSSRFSVGLGPQFMILTNSHDRYKSSASDDFLMVNSKHVMHKYDAGVNAGINYSLIKDKGITVGLWYYTGLMYAIKEDGSPAKNSIIQVLLRIPIVK